MKICAAIGSADEINNIGDAEMVEIRLDVFEQVPKDIKVPIIVKVNTKEQLDNLSTEPFDGYTDIGEMKRPEGLKNVIASYHDMQRTPITKMIVEKMNGFDCDIAKGAFVVNRMSDLVSIYDASKLVTKKHVLIGMGEMGLVTRARSDLLGNEFTFAHTGTPTAEGQIPIGQMRGLGKDGIILGLIGHPLNHSSSKKMHTQALKDAGLNGLYVNFDLTSLDDVETIMRCYNIRGLNVTMPYKKDVMLHLDSVDSVAVSIGAVNTIINDNGKLKGVNTDVSGAEFACKRAGVELDGKKILVMGSGGSARACTHLFKRDGADVSIIGRNAKAVADLCNTFKCTPVTEADPSEFEMVVNCTPIGMYSDSSYPVDIDKITDKQIVFDVTYGVETPLKDLADARKCKRVSGHDMLVGQGMKSFELWTGVTPDYDSMRGSIR